MHYKEPIKGVLAKHKKRYKAIDATVQVKGTDKASVSKSRRVLKRSRSVSNKVFEPQHVIVVEKLLLLNFVSVEPKRFRPSDNAVFEPKKGDYEPNTKPSLLRRHEQPSTKLLDLRLAHKQTDLLDP